MLLGRLNTGHTRQASRQRSPTLTADNADLMRGVTMNPGVGDYDVDKSSHFIQSRNPMWSMSRQKLVKFTESIA